MTSISLKNVGLALVAILGTIGLLGAIYILFMVNGLVVGTTANVAVGDFNGTSGGGSINLSNAMLTHLQGVEGEYISDADTLQSNVTLTLQIFAIVIILVLFGIAAVFGAQEFRKFKGGSKGMRGTGLK